jgi:hypothetical protein
MFCRKCGKEIPNDSTFCSSCGFKVEIKEAVQGKQTSINNCETLSNPLITIDKDLNFFDTFLMYKGKKYLYSEIKSLDFSRFVASMNLMPYMNETGLHIVFDNDEKVSYHIDRSLTRGNTSKLLEQAYLFLQKSTFNLRSNKLVNTLNKNGFITFGIPKIRLYQDGTIEDENGRRLRISKSTESLRISFGKTNHRITDPNEIRISDKPRPFLQFDCFESKNTITFHLHENMDVIRAIFQYFIER